MPIYLSSPVSSTHVEYSSRASHLVRGLTLIEVMVALTISLFLLLGITYVYTGSKQTYRSVASLSTMQENGRLAIEYLTQDLQMAGNFGCATGVINYGYGQCSDTPTPDPPGKDKAYYEGKLYNSLASTSTIANNFRYIVRGYDAKNAVDNAAPGTSASDFSPAFTTTGAPTTALTNSDVVVVRGARPLGSTVVDQVDGASAALTVANSSGLAVNDVAVVANCQMAAVFAVTAVTTTSPLTISHTTTSSKNSCTDLDWGTVSLPQKKYISAEVLKAFSHVYYIALDTTDNIRSLYRQDIGGTAQALVPGIENMQIKYGLSSNIEGYPTKYYTAAEVTDGTPHNCYTDKNNTTLTNNPGANNPWDCVKAVRVELLLVSPEDGVTTDVQKIWFNGSDLTPTDKRLRMVMTATIGVRNRLLQSKD